MSVSESLQPISRREFTKKSLQLFLGVAPIATGNTFDAGPIKVCEIRPSSTQQFVFYPDHLISNFGYSTFLA